MSLATYRGIVENGRVKLCDGIALQDNTEVFVVVPDRAPPVVRVPSPRLVNPNQAALFVKEVIEGESSDDV